MWNRLVGWLPAPGFGDSDAESSAGLQSDTRLKVKVTQSCPTLCDPMNSPGQNPGVGSLSLPQGIFPTQGSNPGFPHCREPRSPTLQVDSLPAEPPGKPKNTAVGSLSLLQLNFLSNPGIEPESPGGFLPTELLRKLGQSSI